MHQVARGMAIAMALLVWLGTLQAAVADARGRDGWNGAVVRSGCDARYPPYSTAAPADGSATGFSVELLRACVQAMRGTASFRIGSLTELHRELEEGRLDALAVVERTREQEVRFALSIPYLTVHSVIVIREDTVGIRGGADLRHRRVAVLQGDSAEASLNLAGHGAQVVLRPTAEIALGELATGNLEAVVLPEFVALEGIRGLGLRNLAVVRPPLRELTRSLCFAVRKGDAELLARLNEGLALSISDGTLRRLQEKWLSPLQAQHRTHSRIVVGGDSNYPPYDFSDSHGQASGFNSDLTRAVAQQMGMRVDIRLGPWAEVRERLKRGELDVVQGMFYSAKRDHEFDFSPPYTTVHHVVVTRNDSPARSSLQDLKGLSILVQDGDIMHDLVLTEKLQARVVAVESQEEALRQLAEGKHDCALVAKVPALYRIEQHGWKNLRVGSTPVLSADYCYAVLKGRRELLSQFTEGLAAVQKSGRYRELCATWLGPYSGEEALSHRAWRYSAWIVTSLLGLLVLSWGWNRSVRRKVERALARSETRFGTIFQNSPIAIWEEDFSAVHERFEELRSKGVRDLKQYLEQNPGEVAHLASRIRVLDVNQASVALIGGGTREEVRRELPRYFTSASLPEMRDEMVALFNGARRFSGDFPTLDLTGRKRLFHVVLSVVPGHESDLSQVIVSFLDVTEQREAQAALQASVEKHRIVADNTYDWEFWVAPNGQFLYCSPSCVRVSGHEACEFLERPGFLASIVYPEDRPAFDQHVHETLEDKMPGACEFRIVCKNGEVRWLEHVCQPVFGNEGIFLGARGSNRDITRRRIQDAEIARLNRLYASLSELNQAIVRVRTREALYQETCRVLVEHGGAKMAWVSELDPETQEARPLAWYGDVHDVLSSLRVRADDRPEGQGPTGTVFREGRSCIVNDFLGDPRTQIFHDQFVRSDWRAAAAFPLRSQGRLCAVLTVYAQETGFFGEREATLLEESAVDVSFALENLHVEELRRRAEAALRESEERVRYSLEASHTGAWDLDVETGILACTDEFYRILGHQDTTGCCTIDQVLGHLVPEDRGRLEQEIRLGLERHSHWGIECRIRRQDGSLRWLWICGRHRADPAHPGTHTVGIVQDVTDRKQAEEALHENSLHLEMTVRAANVGLWDWDLAHGHVFYSTQWKRQIGYEEHEISPALAEWHDRVHPEDLQKVVLTSWLGTPPHEQDHRVEFRLRHKDGTYRWILAQASLLRDPLGQPTRVVGANLDVTERKRTEEVLRQSEKMRVVGQMAGGIAHDFNNLLCGVVGYASMLHQELEHEPHLRRKAEVILTTSQRAADLTARLRSLSRQDDIVLGQLDLHRLIRDACTLLGHSLDRRFRLVHQLEASSSVVQGDASLVQNAIMNLVLNARDAMPQGGVIKVATCTKRLERGLAGTHCDLPPGDYLALSVTDGGTGMSEEVQAHLFEPFFTTKPPGEGTGLGLANVWACVRGHRGGIVVDSEPNRGTAFTLYFPLEEQVHLKEMAPAAPQRGEGTLLIVDDEASLRELAQELLRKLGYHTIEAANGREAVEYCRAHGAEVDLVLLDMLMPEMDGRQALAAIKEIDPNLPVLMCSGAVSDGPVRALDGAEGILEKPYKWNELARRVAEAVEAGRRVRVPLVPHR